MADNGIKGGTQDLLLFLMLWSTNPAVEIDLMKFFFNVFLLCCMSLLSTSNQFLNYQLKISPLCLTCTFIKWDLRSILNILE